MAYGRRVSLNDRAAPTNISGVVTGPTGSSDSGGGSGSGSSSSSSTSSSQTSSSTSSTVSSTTTTTTTTSSTTTTTTSTTSSSAKSLTTLKSSTSQDSSTTTSDTSTSTSSATDTATSATSTSSSSLSITDAPSANSTIPSGYHQTTITSKVVTTINGQAVTTESAIPTMLANTDTNPSSPARRNIAVGAVVGTMLFVLTLLALLFAYRRHRVQRVFSFARLRAKPRSRSQLLADEFEDDDDDLHRAAIGSGSHHPSMHEYKDVPSGSPVSFRGDPSASISSLPHSPYDPSSSRGAHLSPYGQNYANAPQPGAPRLMRPAGSDTGSIFREHVWPPPGERSTIVDPLVDPSSQADLGRIVGDVMGAPAPGAARPALTVDPFATPRGSPVTSPSRHHQSTEGGATQQTPLLTHPSPLQTSPLVDLDSAEDAHRRHSAYAQAKGPNWLDRSPARTGDPRE